jgi:hypothetical protein
VAVMDGIEGAAENTEAGENMCRAAWDHEGIETSCGQRL